MHPGSTPSGLDAAPRGGELAELADAFNAMGDRIKRAQRETARALDEAQNAASAKERFFAAAAHELKTPLGALAGYVELLGMGMHGPVTPQQAEILSRVGANVELIRDLVDDLLDLARLAAGKVDIVSEPVRLPHLLEETVAVVRPAAKRKGLGLELVLEASPEWVRADPLRLKQILLNLLSNAIKFTDEGRIRVSCGWTVEPDVGPLLRGTDAQMMARAPAPRAPPAAVPRNFFVAVEDTGPGIERELHARIFEEFQQTELGRQRRGTGLGLTIAKSLALRMGGDLLLRSEPGRGSTFIVWLPLAPDETHGGASAA